MIEPTRIPTISDSLQTLLDLGVEVNSVIDVGVFEHTRPLMQLFPNVKHHLFEPAHHHFEKIRENYKALTYELHHLALSDSDGEAYLIGRSNRYNNQITHSHLSDRPIDKSEDRRVVGYERIRKAKLDTVFPELDVATPYLLKIDVDGHELEILKGAERALQQASIVVVEAPLANRRQPEIIERAQLLLQSGFYLFDIVGLAYYAKLLHQVDLVFVRSDIVEKSDRLRPREAQPIDRNLWYPLRFNIK